MSRNVPTSAAQAMIDELVAAGYVVHRRKSYDALLERARRAEAQLEWEVEARKSTRRWADKAFDEQRRLSDRLTFVWGIAQAHGATVEELTAQPEGRL
jgi:DNA-binding MarR family transcriptional regulator